MDGKKWALVEKDKWETLPNSYYSLQAAKIFLRLLFTVDHERREYCIAHAICPPDRIRGRKLEAWIDRRRNGDKRCKIKAIKQNGAEGARADLCNNVSRFAMQAEIEFACYGPHLPQTDGQMQLGL